MTTQELLTDAEEKYHALLTGTATVTIQKEGRSRTYQPAEADKLLTYIQQLKSALSTTGTRRRFARVSL